MFRLCQAQILHLREQKLAVKMILSRVTDPTLPRPNPFSLTTNEERETNPETTNTSRERGIKKIDFTRAASEKNESGWKECRLSCNWLRRLLRKVKE